MTISLLKLPFIPLELILLNANLSELIHFSMISKKCYRIVKGLRIPYLTLLEMRVNRESTCVKLKSGKDILGGWHFLNYKEDEDEEMKPIDRIILGCPMKTIILDDHIYSFTLHDVKISVRAGSHYLMDLYKLEIYKAWLDADQVPFARSPYFYPFKNLKDIWIFGEKQMDPDDFKYLVENIAPSYNLSINLPFDPKFKFDSFLKNDSDYLAIGKRAHWITSKMFHSFDNVHLQLFGCRMTAVDCQLFISRWFHSSNTRFETLMLKFIRVPDAYDFTEYELLPFDKERRGFAFKTRFNHYIDCTDGLDIIRSDGLLATILIGPFWIIFHVWHDRFPDLAGHTRYV
ncbi:hypothetical protein CRE_11258 [Caenorhabditis remanei]|uniref:F-box domain-containing protein n=1 Tax=Caenorhabditis remanei TaxID=31234 RepID=E3MQ80_CAERE|nr:hypothetical protein CRE_11258 [Caenorhabditis remanei]